jgi:hypothetical protein
MSSSPANSQAANSHPADSEPANSQPAAFQISAYTPAAADAWDALVSHSPMGTFLHSRRFLSHQGDRFHDCSCLLYNSRQQLVGVFPAAVDPDDSTAVVSHPGLTYGGLIHLGKIVGGQMLEAFGALLKYYQHLGFSTLHYKLVPTIYHQSPSCDDGYALFRYRAQRSACNLSCGVDLAHRLAPSQRRQRSLKKARNAGLEIQTGQAFAEPLWRILEENLIRKLGTGPVHSLPEILDLLAKFSDQIQIVVATQEAQVLAGVVLFHTPQVVRSQYIASNATGNHLCALDLVFEHCLNPGLLNPGLLNPGLLNPGLLNPGMTQRYFDFGTSNQNQGYHLQDSLYQFKSEFGGGGVLQETYCLPLASAELT